ncbi:alpha-glucan water dikinase, chloroplastic isoform X1 [Cinnamomum micranthum f. kanehirae]|uniref:Alpha-glucan water dikinase, chloroplastic isoform X1 n=1 Tax=Cinnamomum micranthum f. kanehirae TaxID=337451 RepID=A0A443PTE8_9MAGN|nr:alpha-glucan water dikinase, chloroplastic isoform X1 [Cinnamomum micranthum f. kanehirae]
MSNTIGHGLLNQSPYHPTFHEHQNKSYSVTQVNSLYHATSPSFVSTKSAHQIQNLLVSTKFREKNFFSTAKTKLPRGRRQKVSRIPRAVLATDPTSELAGRFNLDGGSELQIDVKTPASGSLTQVNMQVTNSSNSLILHWGALHDRKKEWTLPPRRPSGTKIYKNRALRTPFVKTGSESSLTLEIDDPDILAIEFLILDEAQNKWFKDNGSNFRVQLTKDKMSSNVMASPNVSVPEDLVQIQAYLRWERNGKQAYSPEQEKEEFEAARTELLQEVARGTSVEELRAKLTKKDDNSKGPVVQKSKIPDDLVQIQAYIRWEKAGKPNYPPEKQLMEFEEARRDLELELEKGSSLDEIRNKIIKGNIQAKVSKQLQTRKYFTIERIQRKKRDIMHLLNKYATESVEETLSPAPKCPNNTRTLVTG